MCEQCGNPLAPDRNCQRCERHDSRPETALPSAKTARLGDPSRGLAWSRDHHSGDANLAKQMGPAKSRDASTVHSQIRTVT